jgi:hypothetical protein
MRAGASHLWRVAAAAAFGATAALAVTLSRGAPVHAALTSAGTGAAHAASSRPAPAAARCAPAGLRVWLGPGRVSAAAAQYPLEFTNVSRAPCTLTGYPQVAAYRGAAQVGQAAARDTSVVARRVLLAPGQSAHAVVEALVPATRCRPVRASGLRVVLPGQAGARDVSRPLTACTGRGYLLVRAIQAGQGGGAGPQGGVRASPGAA